MSTFELNEEYQDLSDSVREFADEVVAPVSAKHDEEHSFPYEVVKQMGGRWACSASPSRKSSAGWVETILPGAGIGAAGPR